MRRSNAAARAAASTASCSPTPAAVFAARAPAGFCGAPVLFVDRDLCKDCVRRQRRDADRVECPRCRKHRIVRPDTGWCGSCSRPGRPPNPDAACVDCGQVTRLYGAGRCRTCWQRSPHRIAVRAANIAATLDAPPQWLGDFGAYLVGRHHPSRACAMLTRLGKQLADEHPVHPQALLAPARGVRRAGRAVARRYHSGAATPRRRSDRPPVTPRPAGSSRCQRAWGRMFVASRDKDCP